MTTHTFCSSGVGEGLKAPTHGALGVLAGVCAMYNALAFCWRGDRRLFVNTCLYLGIVGLECYQVRRHLSPRP